jgi:NAD(P)-dependent dehydrogenase (short-subunit alcohol dehydrogenase family)
VLGADDGIGSNIILRFSDLGYTVFALFPNQYESPPEQVDDSRKTSKIASLLYSWHRMKERRGRKTGDPSGIVIPISLDTRLHSQRMHAHETVQAYCNTHYLRLVGLIISPPGPYDSQSSEAELSHKLVTESRLYGSTPVFDLLGDNLSDIVAREITEPLLLARDYLRMLQSAQGRLLIISGVGPMFPLDGARLAISQALRDRLEVHGVSVTTIISAPLLPRSGEAERALPSVPSLSPDMKLANVLKFTLSLFSIPEEDLLCAIEQVMLSRYPKGSYSIGIHPYLQSAFDSDIVNLCVKFVT